MTWTAVSLQLFLAQLLQDLWTSGPMGIFFEDVTALVSQLWFQGMFHNISLDLLLSFHSLDPFTP